MVLEWQPNRRPNQSDLKCHSKWQLHGDCHSKRMLQCIFGTDSGNGESDSANPDSYAGRANDFLSGWQRDADLKQC